MRFRNDRAKPSPRPPSGSRELYPDPYNHGLGIGNARAFLVFWLGLSGLSQDWPPRLPVIVRTLDLRTNMNKSLLMASLIAAFALAACGKKEEAPAPAPAAAPAPAPMASEAAASAAAPAAMASEAAPAPAAAASK